MRFGRIIQVCALRAMRKLSDTRDKIYGTATRQMHGVVPCRVCSEHDLALLHPFDMAAIA